MSINKAQASLLAEGFLDDIGSVKPGDFQPRETITELLLLGGELIESAQANLNNSNTNASGKLSESIEAEEPIVKSGIIQIDITMLFYGQFINKGVKGRKSGSGVYAFKYDAPSAKFVKAIKEYIKTASKKITNTNKAKTISKNELKNASVSEIDNAYAMARSIIQHGIKPTGFMDKAITTTEQKIENRLQSALKVDIINSLPDKI
jgi:hypothetical protein